ncbi:MAG: hypothetical protein F4218_06430 [Synechococcus sp. SB0677_bin_5]|nr:hypothetical protein [Synechococcus sp. SB0677_bin_5]
MPLAFPWRTAETIKESAECCAIALSTAHRGRHRFLAALRQAPDRLAGIVEVERPSCWSVVVARALNIPHESINASAGERVRGPLHIQTVKSHHTRVKTYPTLSQKYGETVCTAGVREDGSWMRLYPLG